MVVNRLYGIRRKGLKSLVIVESPAKARTLNKILGKNFNIKASIGHVKDLPLNDLGVDINNNFKPHYQTISGKEKILRELKKEAKNADSIYLATDPDREGEAIAYHIAEEIKKQIKSKLVYRITFHEITKKAVEEAIQNPGSVNLDKVFAQQARRILDRLVGYNLSPFLWKKVKKGLSAGRVQSVALRLIVEREKEIKRFIKEEYWTIEALFQHYSVTDSVTSPSQFKARLYKFRDLLIVDRDKKGKERFLIRDEKEANDILTLLKDKEYRIVKVETKQKKKYPSPPFITSTLQQEAARRFKYSAMKTMKIAQELYEGIELGSEGSFGLITYMRTDSVNVAQEAQRWARDYIKLNFGKEYVPDKLPQYKNKKTSQEAHEAIRPTYSDKSPEKVKPYLTKEQYNIYSLIWNRFIASQMSPAQLEQTVFFIEPFDSALDLKGTEFRASGTVIKFLGFMSLYKEANDEISEEDEGILPLLQENSLLKLLGIEPIQHFTQPPPRYSEATLVKVLEEKGIGRPSTYATILATIQDRKYVKKEEGKFIPTELGMIVSDLLVAKFPDLMDVSFTARMEDNLDEIENSNLNWVEVVRDFYIPFQQELEKAIKDTEKVKPVDIPTDLICEKCGQKIVSRWGKHGRFLACSGYPKCKNTKQINDSIGVNDREPETVNENCEKCGKAMIVRNGKFGKFLACSGYPDCKNTKPFSLGIQCPVDGGDILERKTKKGKLFWSCSNYPQCTFATWYRPISQSCPECEKGLICEKVDKSGKTIHFCISKDCNYSEEVRFVRSVAEEE